MKRRPFGSLPFETSVIGFGTWGLAGDAYGPTHDEESVKALQTAFTKGINFFDTADLYGNGHSEQLLRKALGSVREEIIIATKGGTLPHSGFYMPQDFSKEYLERALHLSLRRLGTETIDVYQLHSPPLEDLDPEVIAEFAEQSIKAGKIRAFGISFRTPPDALNFLDLFLPDAIQVNFNLIDQRAVQTGLFDLCLEKGIAVIVRTPLCFGFLTGKYKGEEKFEAPDHRANWPQDQIRRWARAPKLFASLNKNTTRSIPQLALQYCYFHRAVSTVIPGMMTRKEVLENVRTVELPGLTLEEVEQIESIYQKNTFFDRSIKPKALEAEKQKSAS